MTKRWIGIAVLALCAVLGQGIPNEGAPMDRLSCVEATTGLGAELSLSQQRDEFGKIRMQVQVDDGMTDKTLTPRCSTPGGIVEYDDSLAIRQTFTPAGNHVRWKLSFLNNGDRQRWLHIRLIATPELDGKTALFDGRNYLDPCTADTIAEDNNVSVPLAIIHRQQLGLAWGIHPKQILSYIEEGALVKDRAKPGFFFGTKLVIDAHQAETLDIMMFGFQARFGYLDAFQRYYAEFPETFSIKRPDVDPRLTHGGCDYAAWVRGQPELVRRFGGRWDWCLNAFVHRGDWIVSKKYWDVGRTCDSKQWNNTGKWDKVDAWAKGARKKHETGQRCDAAMLFYICTALSDLDAGLTPLKDTFWPEAYAGDVGTYHYCYPWGPNNYARHSMQTLGEAIEQSAIAGIAMDTANSSLKHFGAGIETAPGRAYQNQGKAGAKKKTFLEDGTAVEVTDTKSGVYSRVNAGSALFMDYIHTLRKGRFNLGLVVNAPDWLEGFRTDSVLIEHPPGMQSEELWVQRLYCGQKVFSWWDDFRLYQKIDWQNMSPEQIRNSIAAFSRFVRLQSYLLGGIPMRRIASGNRILFEVIPELDLLTQAGWQPVTAMRTDKRLWLSRYGEGLNTYLVLCNPKGKDVSTVVDVDTSYLGGGGFAFVDARGGPLSGKIQGEKTSIDLKVVSAREMVLAACARIEAPGTAGSLTIRTTTKNTLDVRTVTLDVAPEREMTAGLTLSVPDGYYFDKALVNGKPLSISQDLCGIVRFAGATQVQLVYRSLYFVSPGTAFLEFPFANNATPAAEIVIPDEASEEEQYIASRIQEYFKFYFKNAYAGQIENFELPVVAAGKMSANKAHILVGRAAEDYRDFWPWTSPARVRIGVDPEKKVLYVTSLEQCDDDLRAGLYRLLGHLDNKYTYYGRIGEDASFGNEQEQALFEKSGLMGKTLGGTPEEAK